MEDAEKRINFITLFCLAIFYLSVRLLAWKINILYLDDHDSVSYIKVAKILINFNLESVFKLSADTTPFYPFFAAVCSLPGWSVETAARFCSMLFSCLLFYSVMKIGMLICDRTSNAMGILILSLSPILIFLSKAILTESSYIALIYFGFWLFLYQHKFLSLRLSAFLGFIYGLTFLSRTEGFLYIIFIPILQIMHYCSVKEKNYDLKKLTFWIILYTMCFFVVAGPQIWLVSYKTGSFAINGRQLLIKFLNHPDHIEKSYQEKMFGLDYSPKQVNVVFVAEHPEVITKGSSSQNFNFPVKTLVKNFYKIYQNLLGELIGPLGFIFMGFGILGLYNMRTRFEIILILTFIAFNLVAPLLAIPVKRHLAVILPVIFLTEGIGIVYVARILSTEFRKGKSVKIFFISLCVVILIGSSIYPLKKIFNPSKRIRKTEFKVAIAKINEIEENELFRPAVIVSRKSFLPYFTDSKQLSLPYADYEKLVTYCKLNKVDFLFLQHKLISTWPFFSQFINKKYFKNFTLIYNDKNKQGYKIDLYRYNKD